MRSHLPAIVLITAGLAGGLALGAPTVSALAQTSAAPASPASNEPAQSAEQTSPSSEMPGGHMFGRMSRLSPDDRAALFDARVAAIHAGLHLTPDQEKLWPAVEGAARDGMKTMLDLHEKFRAAGGTPNIVDRLQRASEMLIARGQAMKKVADAAQPLYASLTDEQKHRLPMLMQAGRRGWREQSGTDARQRDRDSSMEGNRFGSNGSQDRARGSDDHDRYDRSNRGYDSDWGQGRPRGSDEDRDFDRRGGGYDHGCYRGRRGGYDDRDFDRRDQGYDSGWRGRRGPDDERNFDQRDRGWDRD